MPYKINLTRGALWEIPPMVTPSLLGNLPTGGGWGLRVFPQRIIHKTIRELNGAGAPAVIFLHPRELDPSWSAPAAYAVKKIRHLRSTDRRVTKA